MVADSRIDQQWMALALMQAQQAATRGEVPVGAVLVRDEVLLAGGFNCPIGTHDPTAHAEIVALRAASQQAENYRLPGTTLYVTIEP
ncbi:MAG: nucleoside deaminase, partial [Spongiibacteraceae bacterium]